MNKIGTILFNEQIVPDIHFKYVDHWTIYDDKKEYNNQIFDADYKGTIKRYELKLVTDEKQSYVVALTVISKEESEILKHYCEYPNCTEIKVHGHSCPCAYNTQFEGIRDNYIQKARKLSLKENREVDDIFGLGKGTIKKGKKHGLWTEYDIINNTKFCGYYKNGERNGKCYENWFSTRIYAEGSYINNKRSGFWTLSNSEHEWNVHCDDPKAVIRTSNSNSKFSDSEYETGVLVDGVKEGIWILRYGETIEYALYSHGLKNGLCKSVYHNGVVSSQGSYQDGYNHGQWSFYHDNGQMSAHGTFDRGEKEKTWRYWYRNGNKREIEHYNNGRKHGIICKYYESGKRRVQGEYNNGKKIGCFKYYDESGRCTKKTH